MVVIYTGIEEIDKELQKVIKDSIVAHYSEYLVENNTFEGQTAVISLIIKKSKARRNKDSIRTRNLWHSNWKFLSKSNKRDTEETERI